MHHAQYLIGNSALKPDLLRLIKKELKAEPQANPDFFNRTYETFAIDDARELKSIHETRPVKEDGKKIFMITTNGITVEAQNALLKLFEEPGAYAHFFLMIPSEHLLLATIKSRMQELRLRDTRYEIRDTTEAQKFLKQSHAKRLETIKSLMDDISKEKKTKQDAIEFLNGVEAVLYEKGVKENLKSLEAIQMVRKYIHDRAPSIKMLLEYVALIS
jgi:DNA polymerase III delta prime subunit